MPSLRVLFASFRRALAQLTHDYRSKIAITKNLLARRLIRISLYFWRSILYIAWCLDNLYFWRSKDDDPIKKISFFSHAVATILLVIILFLITRDLIKLLDGVGNWIDSTKIQAASTVVLLVVTAIYTHQTKRLADLQNNALSTQIELHSLQYRPLLRLDSIDRRADATQSAPTPNAVRLYFLLRNLGESSTVNLSVQYKRLSIIRERVEDVQFKSTINDSKELDSKNDMDLHVDLDFSELNKVRAAQSSPTGFVFDCLIVIVQYEDALYNLYFLESSYSLTPEMIPGPEGQIFQVEYTELRRAAAANRPLWARKSYYKLGNIIYRWESPNYQQYRREQHDAHWQARLSDLDERLKKY